MTLLLCPECCQWREPVEGRCPVCAGSLDVAIPDPSLETIADEIGNLQGLLGKAELSRTTLPNHGQLYATCNGLLFVPSESVVIVFAAQTLPAHQQISPRGGKGDRTIKRQSWFGRLPSLWWSRLSGRESASRFACERRENVLTSCDRLALAELLRDDPGVWFLSRGCIATWRRQRREWDFVRPNGQSWPEQISMHDRDGDRALQTWLETTECPLPVNVR